MTLTSHSMMSSVAAGKEKKGMNECGYTYCAIDVFSILSSGVIIEFVVYGESVHCSGVSFQDRQALRGHY